MNQNLAEILAGSFGGVVQVLVGQPFDTVKVRLQSAPPGTYQSTSDCVLQTVKNEGLSAFYKGTMSPLLGIAFCVSIQFGTLEEMKRFFRTRSNSTQLTPTQFYVAGAVAGVANSFVSGPVEHIRSRMQVQVTGSKLPPKYASTLDCFKKVYSQYGLRGIYKGQLVTIIREFQGYGGYFFAYESLAQYLSNKAGTKVSELPTWKVMLCGAAAGYAMWIPIFPVDVIKSRIQVDSFDPSTKKYTGIMDCFRKTFKAEGLRGLYRGFLPCFLRAGPVNASTFVAYEFAMNNLFPRR